MSEASKHCLRMPVWLQVVSVVVSLAVGLGGVALAVGAVLQRLTNLEQRHAEGMTEMRAFKGDHEGRLRAVEKESTISSTHLKAAKSGGP